MEPTIDNLQARNSAALPDKCLELQHLLSSGIVRDRSQLHSLLRYLGERSLDSPAGPLKEYTIGIEALNKPTDYDPRVDPTIRVEVARLRKKLDEYYTGAGAGRPFRMLIPKGSYLPEWVVDAPVAPSNKWKKGKRLWIAAAAALVVGTAAVWLALSLPHLPEDEFQTFWAPHLGGSTPTLLVYGTPLFVKVQGNYFRDPHVNNAQEVAESEDVRRVIRALEPREVRPVFNFTGLGEADAVFLLTRALASRKVTLNLKRSNNVTWDDLRNTNVVFLGGPKFNPQMRDLPYSPKYQATSPGIANLHPKETETAVYTTVRRSPHGEILEEFALISAYPGLDEHTRILTMECYSTEGTLAAAEFLTRPETLRDLRDRMGEALTGSKPASAFQVVVKARFNAGVVVKLSYVTHTIFQ